MAPASQFGSRTIPAPVGGWNARDPLEDMKDLDAVSLVNFFPTGSTIDLRGGFRSHSTAIGAPSPVETLTVFHGSDGTEHLIAGGGGSLYNASAYGDPATELDDGFTEDRWQSANFKGVLLLVNGTDQPQQYNGTALSAATYTGITTDNNLISVCVYKGRLYFAEKATAKIWYGGAGDITGALTEYNISTLFQGGGYIEYLGTWSRDTGTGLENMLVAISSEGEVLTFTGGYPGDTTTWTIACRFALPKILGRRACTNMGADLLMLSQDGVYPLSAVLAASGVPEERARLTYKIQPAFKEAARMYHGNMGWEALQHPEGHILYINSPKATNGEADQFVMNTLTGAWCKFTGMNACSWALFGGRPYFGGTDGVVYEADSQESDNDALISTEVKWAYNYLGSPQVNKVFTLAKPLMRATEPIDFLFGCDVDFEQEPVTGSVSVTGTAGLYFDFAYDSDYSQELITISEWRALTGFGRCCSLNFAGNFKDVQISISAAAVNYGIGGVI